MSPSKELKILSAAWGVGAQDQGCSQGPLYLAKQSLLTLQSRSLHWHKSIQSLGEFLDHVIEIGQLSLQLANQVNIAVHHEQPFLTIGGDHSCAIGTWSGAATALQNKGDLGLIWIDAHEDAHTFFTTPSGRIHGMPLACLLGHGAPVLTEVLSPGAKLKPEQICLIGIRSYEPGEHELLTGLGVRIFMMSEVEERGLDTIIGEAKAIVSQGTVAYGVSIDLDALDPIEVPGVCSKEPNGLKLQELSQALQSQIRNDPKFIGAELAEFNPSLDHENKTVHAIQVLTQALFEV